MSFFAALRGALRFSYEHIMTYSDARMERCKHCERRLWMWQKRLKNAHESCEKTSRLFDKTLKNMQKEGYIPNPKEFKKKVAEMKKLRRCLVYLGHELRVNEAFALWNPRNCPVIEKTADGVEVGTCTFHAPNGICPRHGKLEYIEKGWEGAR